MTSPTPFQPFKRVRSTPEVITRVHSAPVAPDTARLSFQTHRILYPEYLDARGAKEIVYRGFLNYPDKIGKGERWQDHLPGNMSPSAARACSEKVE